MFGRTKLVLGLLGIMAGSTASYARIYDVRLFGAAGNKLVKDTNAVQTAIDTCSGAGGGTVYFPAGDYLCGVVQLRSNVRIYLDAGATIWASRDKDDYRISHTLLTARGIEHISIEGNGTIRGIGEADLGRRPGEKEERPDFRAGTMNFYDCNDVLIRGINIRYSDTWTIHLRGCEDVLVDGVSILNNYFHTNSDGIDPVSCKNVRISNCHIVAGDDCIVLKTVENRPCENIVVTNCTMESIATAVKLGTESPADFRNIHFSNCTIRNSTVGIGLYIKDGASVERVSFSNMSIENCPPAGLTNLEKAVYPIFVDIEKRDPNSSIGKISDISFDNIQIYSGAGILIQGMPQSPIENLTMRDITFRVYQPYDYANRIKHIGGRRSTSDERDTLFVRKPSYVTLAYIDGLTADNIRVLMTQADFDRYGRCAFYGGELSNCVIRNVFRSPCGAGSDSPIMSLDNCQNTLVADCIAAPAAPCVVKLTGEKTKAITIDTTGMACALKTVVQGEEVPPDAVKN